MIDDYSMFLGIMIKRSDETSGHWELAGEVIHLFVQLKQVRILEVCLQCVFEVL